MSTQKRTTQKRSNSESGVQSSSQRARKDSNLTELIDVDRNSDVPLPAGTVEEQTVDSNEPIPDTDEEDILHEFWRRYNAVRRIDAPHHVFVVASKLACDQTTCFSGYA